MKDIVKVIGNNIKNLREKNGYSRNKLSQLSGIHLAWLSKVEMGERKDGKQIAPSVIVLNKIADALNVKLEDLVKDTGVKSKTISDNEILTEIKGLLKKQNSANKQLFIQMARKILK